MYEQIMQKLYGLFQIRKHASRGWKFRDSCFLALLFVLFGQAGEEHDRGIPFCQVGGPYSDWSMSLFDLIHPLSCTLSKLHSKLDAWPLKLVMPALMLK